jgi:hypothetical protein
MNFDSVFLNWIRPLLEYRDYEILIKHTQASPRGHFRLKNYSIAMKKFKMSKREIYLILWRLEFLTELYERLAWANIV